MRIKFTKMHGLGNDFVVIDAIRQNISLTPDQVRLLADRHFGVGCDQVLLVEKPRAAAQSDFRYRIYNADGGEVEQCGNGVRCFARFVQDQGLTSKTEIVVETNTGTVRVFAELDDQVRVNMGVPGFAPGDIPFLAECEALFYPLEVNGQRLEIGAVSVGNPHAVLMVDAIQQAPLITLGPLIEHHARFPQRVNVGFMERVSAQHIRLRVFERGAGETLACGTGACAAVAVGRKRGVLEALVRVDLPGGTLTIQWQGDGAPIWMSGPATRVFDGEVDL